MRVKTANLTEQQLIHVLGLPDLSWQTCGPIIEREGIDVIRDPNGTAGWRARNWLNFKEAYADGPTPLIAAMRCYVLSKLGAEVDIPAELVK